MRDEVGITVERRCFRTRARTVDHLGRGQIADVPTAISELWKNSWDAYARKVALTIFKDPIPAAVMIDDGHGMSEDDFYDRWLVVGTESKLRGADPTPEERNGVPVRPKQGRKGIGRLSVAKLGAVLFMLTRRRNHPLFASLIDWRMFENPYIDLDDVPVASGNFSTLKESLIALPDMIELLISSVVSAGSKKWREGEYELRPEWARFDEDQRRNKKLNIEFTPSRDIIQSHKNLIIDEYLFRGWSGHGTALVVSNVDDGLHALISSEDTDVASSAAKSRMIATLSNFVDTFGQPDETPRFQYCVKIARADDNERKFQEVIVESGKSVDRARVANLEHQIEGTVDEAGVFTGRVRSFGQWIDGDVKIEPPADLKMPKRSDGRVGKFQIYLATMEWDSSSSTHSQAEHNLFQDLALNYAGMLIFRDGMRVLPYGREDNDFFEIEKRRSKNAGRHFWSHRRMFGRVALTNEENPNLKDKAGREGIIDNTASRVFREIIINILETSAERYFGSASSDRREKLRVIRRDNMDARSKEYEKKFKKRKNLEILEKIQKMETILPETIAILNQETDELNLRDDSDLVDANEKLSDWKSQLEKLTIHSPEPEHAALKKKYNEANRILRNAAEAVHAYEAKLKNALAEYQPRESNEIVKQCADGARFSMRGKIDELGGEARTLLLGQMNTVQTLADERNKKFSEELERIVNCHMLGAIDLGGALEKIANIESRWESECRAAFNLYISASAAIKERIDIEMLASTQMRRVTEANREVERLNALAQLGIAVEITAHDLVDYDTLLRRSIDKLPDDIKSSDIGSDLRIGIEGLTSQLYFLAPIRLSENEYERNITGVQIEEFVTRYFYREFNRKSIMFTTTEAFRNFSVCEKRTRIFPVFLNLLNNAIYWVSTSPPDNRHIAIDFDGSSVVVSDSGPGVETEDIPRIFDLFFTRKKRSGRGVGLYLAQSNLAAGGHTIHYSADSDRPLLDGAAFYITFHKWKE